MGLKTYFHCLARYLEKEVDTTSSISFFSTSPPFLPLHSALCSSRYLIDTLFRVKALNFPFCLMLLRTFFFELKSATLPLLSVDLHLCVLFGWSIDKFFLSLYKRCLHCTAFCSTEFPRDIPHKSFSFISLRKRF